MTGVSQEPTTSPTAEVRKLAACWRHGSHLSRCSQPLREAWPVFSRLTLATLDIWFSLPWPTSLSTHPSHAQPQRQLVPSEKNSNPVYKIPGFLGSHFTSPHQHGEGGPVESAPALVWHPSHPGHAKASVKPSVPGGFSAHVGCAGSLLWAECCGLSFPQHTSCPHFPQTPLCGRPQGVPRLHLGIAEVPCADFPSGECGFCGYPPAPGDTNPELGGTR